MIDDPDRNQLYLVMEFVAGGTLAEPIDQKRRVPEEEMRGRVAGSRPSLLRWATRTGCGQGLGRHGQAPGRPAASELQAGPRPGEPPPTRVVGARAA